MRFIVCIPSGMKICPLCENPFLHPNSPTMLTSNTIACNDTSRNISMASLVSILSISKGSDIIYNLNILTSVFL